jgi:sterol desaturase/sphingolipid hydroxylase (fatty acid hydroxylase superfamily)
VHAIFTLVHTGLAPAPGHVGFDKVVIGEDSAFDTHSYEHYLHHKLFECNYADGVIPLDAWFDTFHDGSEESEARLQARLQARAARRLARRRARPDEDANKRS